MSDENVLIIGAGPFGLSISAHLSALGIAHRIVGQTMDTWEAHMPVGMNLKSEPYASGIAAPSGKYDVAEYCRQHGLPYVNRVGPLSLERFTGYAAWYAKELVPDVSDVTATMVSRTDDGFGVSVRETQSLTAKSVVVATGVLPHAHVPPNWPACRPTCCRTRPTTATSSVFSGPRRGRGRSGPVRPGDGGSAARGWRQARR